MQVRTIQGPPLRLEPFQRFALLAHFAGVPELLWMLPKGQGKTTVAAAIAVHHLLETPFPRCFVGAATGDQADTLYSEACRIARQFPLELRPLPGYKSIHLAGGRDEGFLQVLRSDKFDQGSLEGLAPTLGVVEELHAHRNDALYAAIQGALHKRGGQMLTITTAGAYEDSILGVIRARALRFRDVRRFGPLRIAASPAGRFLMLEWSLPDGADPHDMAAVKLANPASFVTEESLRGLHDSPSMTEARWLRYHCNVWTTLEGKWIEPAAWHAAEAEAVAIPPGELVVLGYDHARSYDHASLVAIHPTGEKQADVVPVRTWVPAEHDGGKIPYRAVEQAIIEACERWSVPVVGYDKLGGFARSAEVLEEEYGIPMLPISMKSHVWAPLTAELRAAIRSKRLRHPGDPELTRHVLAGEYKDSPHGERLHGHIRDKVDALMALGIAWYAAFETDALSAGHSPWERRQLAGEALL